MQTKRSSGLTSATTAATQTVNSSWTVICGNTLRLEPSESRLRSRSLMTPLQTERTSHTSLWVTMLSHYATGSRSLTYVGISLGQSASSTTASHMPGKWWRTRLGYWPIVGAVCCCAYSNENPLPPHHDHHFMHPPSQHDAHQVPSTSGQYSGQGWDSTGGFGKCTCQTCSSGSLLMREPMTLGR